MYTFLKILQIIVCCVTLSNSLISFSDQHWIHDISPFTPGFANSMQQHNQ